MKRGVQKNVILEEEIQQEMLTAPFDNPSLRDATLDALEPPVRPTGPGVGASYRPSRGVSPEVVNIP